MDGLAELPGWVKGAGGIGSVALILWMVFGFVTNILHLKDRRANGKLTSGAEMVEMRTKLRDICERMTGMCQQVDDLHVWHKKTDDDGVPVWYVRRSLEQAIGKLAENIGTQTQVLQSLVAGQTAMQAGVEDIRRKAG